MFEEPAAFAVALAECAIWSGRGARLRLGVPSSPAVELFGESPSRVIVTCRPSDLAALEAIARSAVLPLANLGTVGGRRLVIELTGEGATGAAEERGSRVADAVDASVADLAHAWANGLSRALGQATLDLPLGVAAAPEPAAPLVPGEG